MSHDLLVKLQIYEGPLDLLLHLIKKNEVDLNDIPVALITAQYLEYLSLMESLNVEMAADFLVMAATLTQIKSRLLLPYEGSEEEEAELAENLKASIIDPLLEHMRFRGFRDFKDAAEALRGRQMLGSDVFVRGAALDSIWEEKSSDTASLDAGIEASLFDLVDAFRRLGDKKTVKTSLNFVVETKNIAERIMEVKIILIKNKKMLFEDICANDRIQAEVVLSFLAVLELARIGFLRLYQNLDKIESLQIFLANPDADLGDLSQLDY